MDIFSFLFTLARSFSSVAIENVNINFMISYNQLNSYIFKRHIAAAARSLIKNQRSKSKIKYFPLFCLFLNISNSPKKVSYFSLLSRDSGVPYSPALHAVHSCTGTNSVLPCTNQGRSKLNSRHRNLRLLIIFADKRRHLS